MAAQINPQVKREKWYEFGPFQLRLPERLLVRTQDGQAVSLTPKAIETLRVLVERSPHVVEKDDLLKEVWSESIVEEATLAQNIFTLRKVLAEHDIETTAEETSPPQHHLQQHYIATVPKRGYRFSAPVRLIFPQPAQVKSISDSAQFRRNLSIITSPAVTHTNLPAEVENHPPVPLSQKVGLSRRHRIFLFITLLILSLMICAALPFWLMKWRSQLVSAVPQSNSFQRMKMDRLTNNCKTSTSVIAPDGNCVAYVLNDNGEESLWVRQVVSSSNVQIVPPRGLRFSGLTFSPDSNYIFYTAFDETAPQGTLYAVPALGGVSRKVLDNIAGPISFSPDGQQLAFFHQMDRSGSELVIANSDGRGERVLARRNLPDMFAPLIGPAWSPRGDVIACSVASFSESYYSNIVLVSVADGREKPLPSRHWYRVGQAQWISDGSALVFIGADEESGFNQQIWRAEYPGGELRRITNDRNNYDGISLTSDSGTLVTVQTEQISQIWTAPNGDAARAVKLTNGKYDGAVGISWVPDGRLLYTSLASGKADLWIMNPDGSERQQITVNAGVNLWPTVSTDGQHIVVASNRSGNFHLWRMNLNGSEQKPLTNGGGEVYSRISPDSRWVLYTSFNSGTQPLWKIPIDGHTTPQQLTELSAFAPAISPNGKTIACFYETGAANKARQLAIFSSEGGKPLKLFDVPYSASVLAGLQWSADGQAIHFVNTVKGVSNIWRLPINGSAPQPVTQFKSDRIFWYDWSRDGKQLAMSRGTEMSDALLIKDFN